MNKLLTKIVGVALGATMAIGVGVAVANSDRGVSKASADGTDSISFTSDNFTGLGSNSYGNGAERTGSITSTTGGDTYDLGSKYTTINSGWQWQASNGITYNKTELPGRITNITVTQTGTARQFFVRGGTSLCDTSSSGTQIGDTKSAASMSWDISSGTDYTYFVIGRGSNAAKVTNITVTFETGGSGGSGPTALTNPNPQYDDSNKTVSWTSDANATKYQVKVDVGNYSDINTATYDASGLSVGESHTVYIKAVGDEINYSSTEGSVTFTPTAPFVAKDFVQCTSTSDLEAGASYIITNGISGSVSTMSTETNSNNRRSTAVTVSNSKISSTSSTLTLTLGGSTGAWTFHTENYTSTDGYLSPGSSTSNARLFVNSSNDNYGLYTISFSSGKAVITSTGKSSYHILKCNPNSGNPLFACYSSGQNDVYLWKEYSTKTLESLSITGTPTKLTGYYDTDDFDPTGITSYVANYDNGSTKTLSASDITWPALTAGMTTIRGSYTEDEVTVYTPTYNISVSADAVSTVSLSGSMTTSYNTNDSWDKGSLVVTANYLSGKHETVTGESTFAYYSDSAMNTEVASPAALGVGNNQTIYVKATYSGISNTTGYSQTVSVETAPVEQTKTINLVDCALNDVNEQSTSEVTLGSGVATLNWVKNGGATNANNYMGGTGTYTHTRIYKNHDITISANGNKLKEVLFSVDTPSNLNVTITGGTYSNPESGIAKITASANTTSISLTPSNTAQVTQVVIKYYAPNVSATGITINGQSSSSVSITPYQTTRLVASVAPLDATDRTFSFSLNPSGANAIITIDANGNVEPIADKYGTTVVTATSTDGGFTATCSVTVERVSYHQAVYDPTSTSTASTSGTIPAGASHTFESDRFTDGAVQMTGSESMSLTLTGYAGQKIRAVILKMHSNQSGGAGSLSVTAGSTTIASISSATFASDSWNGEYTTEWVLIEPTVTQYDVQTGESVVISISASANSLYVDEIRVQYEASEIDTSAVDFAQLILDDLTCDDSGQTVLSTSEWGALVELWNDGTTITAAGKLVLLEAEAIEHANPTTDQEIIEAAMAKYDYIVGKYNKTLGLVDDYEDFINRNPDPVGGSRVNPADVIINNSTVSTVVIILSVLGLTAVGGYFFMRKKKEQ